MTKIRGFFFFSRILATKYSRNILFNCFWCSYSYIAKYWNTAFPALFDITETIFLMRSVTLFSVHVLRISGTYFVTHIIFVGTPHFSSYDPTDLLFSLAQQPLMGLGLLLFQDSWSHSDTPQLVGLPWTSFRHVTGTSTWRLTTLTRDTSTAPGGIQTRGSRMRADVDPCMATCIVSHRVSLYIYRHCNFDVFSSCLLNLSEIFGPTHMSVPVTVWRFGIETFRLLRKFNPWWFLLLKPKLTHWGRGF